MDRIDDLQDRANVARDHRCIYCEWWEQMNIAVYGHCMYAPPLAGRKGGPDSLPVTQWDQFCSRCTPLLSPTEGPERRARKNKARKEGGF